MLSSRIKLIITSTLLLLFSTKALAEKPVYYVYLAGPEVFLSDPIQAGVDKKKLISTLATAQDWPFELIGLYPMDNEIPNFKPNAETGMRIYHANLDLMNKAHFIAANMVRFRGPSMDVGTAFEMGYMAGADKPVFAYYDAKPFYGANEVPGLYKERVKTFWSVSKKDASLDQDGIAIENFSMTDNLMMVGSHTDTGYEVASSFQQTILNIGDYILKQKIKPSNKASK